METERCGSERGGRNREVTHSAHNKRRPVFPVPPRLNFDYKRSFQSIEIPLVHITHPGGGTTDILPSAITNNPNPAVVNAPAYHDFRVKSVRTVCLEPGDITEYSVTTPTPHQPVAPTTSLTHA